MSDEFVDVILGKLVEALRPSPFDQLEEPTLNAALAIIDATSIRAGGASGSADHCGRILGATISSTEPTTQSRARIIAGMS
jgi:hypothetical protein